MSNEPVTTLFLAVPGTQETRELDLKTVQDGVARGEIPLDNWAWSAQRNEWLPLSQLPEFVTALVQAVRVEPKKVEPRIVAAAPAVQSQHPVATSQRTRYAITQYSRPMEEAREFPIFKLLFFVLFVVLVALVVVNYYLVDRPFRESMAKTPFAEVQTHAHLGAFVQPNVLLIHILPNRAITPDNFADLLTALTQSAPHQAFAGYPFDTVSLTSAWRGQYALPVQNWSRFADMNGYSADDKKRYVLSHLELIDGEPLIRPEKNLDAAKRQAHEDQAWNELVSHFQGT